MPRSSGAGRRHRSAAGRVLAYLVTVWLAVTIVFVLPRFMPGDPLAIYDDAEAPLSPEARAALEAHYHLDRPLLAQYGLYLQAISRGDLGQSILHRSDIGLLLRRRLPWTLLLMGTALVASSVISFLAGVTAAWRRGSWGDRRLVTLMTALYALPEYVLATALLLAFAVVLQIFPLAGGSTPFTTDSPPLYKLADVAYHLVLPATALTMGLIGTKFLLVRNTTITVLGQEYMVLARAKGLSQRLLKYRHAGRNVLLPFLTVVGLQAGFAAGGSLFVETVFGYPGMASLMLPAVDARDYPLLEASFLVLALLVLSVNLVIDLAYARLDPRVDAE